MLQQLKTFFPCVMDGHGRRGCRKSKNLIISENQIVKLENPQENQKIRKMNKQDKDEFYKNCSDTIIQ